MNNTICRVSQGEFYSSFKLKLSLLFFFALPFSFPFFANAQAANGSSNFRVLPPSPEATRYSTFGNLGISHSTGLPNIDIPIYNIQLKNFNWPISIRYNARGNKVDDIASNIGLGWNLNINGLISAVVHDQSDIKTPHQNDPSILLRDLDLSAAATPGTYNNNQDVYGLALPATEGYRNLMPDIFSVNIGNINHKMFLINDWGYTMPASNLKVRLYRNSNNEGTRFEITDESGHSYFLSAMGQNRVLTLCPGRNRVTDPNPVFYLDSIKTYNGEKITFRYKAQATHFRYYKTPTEVFAEKAIFDPNPSAPCNRTDLFDIGAFNSFCRRMYTATEPLLDYVEVSNGTTITLDYENRLDVGNSSEDVNIMAVRKIYVRQSGRLIRSFEFDNSDYFGSGSSPDDLRLKLNRLIEKGNDGKVVGIYKFDYNLVQLPNRQSLSVDASGYFNQSDNTNLIVHPTFTTIRSSTLEGTKACVLERITYPTSGYTEFDFELSGSNEGGLRVKSIVDHDGERFTNRRLYNYASTGWQSCGSWDEPDTQYFFYELSEADGGSSDQNLAMCELVKHHSEYYCLPSSYFDNPGTFYTRVEELFESDGDEGKIEYLYDWKSLYEGYANLPVNLVEKLTYKKTDNDFGLLKKEKNHFEHKISGSTGLYDDVVGLKEKRIWGKEIKLVRGEVIGRVVSLPMEFNQTPIRFLSLPHYLKKTETWDYDNNGKEAYSQTVYHYDNDMHGLPTRIDISNSQAENFVTVRNYPQDYTSTDFISTLIGKNKITEPIEEVKINFSKNLVVDATITTFNTQGYKSTIYQLERLGTYSLPLSQYRFSNTAAAGTMPHLTPKSSINIETILFSKKVEFAQYQNLGSPAYIKTQSNSFGYKWDLQFQKIVGECINASPSEFMFEDFEGDGVIFGNTLDALTGKRAITGTTELQNFFSPTFNNRSYVLNYAIFRDGKWQTVTEPYSGQSITGLIDNVRIYPIGSQIKTFSYDVDGLMSSSADENGIVTYYEYDTFQRLKLILDSQKKVVKQYNYGYTTTDSSR
jgi:hypothetical protein